MTKFTMFQTVRVVRIPERDARVIHDESFRAPRIGDTGAVIEVYTTPHERYWVEAVAPSGGCDWLMEFLPEELEPE